MKHKKYDVIVIGGGHAGTEAAAEALSAAYSNLDKTAQRGIIHRKNASRRKSRLARLANAAS